MIKKNSHPMTNNFVPANPRCGSWAGNLDSLDLEKKLD